jgi:hypothetical protein
MSKPKNKNFYRLILIELNITKKVEREKKNLNTITIKKIILY